MRRRRSDHRFRTEEGPRQCPAPSDACALDRREMPCSWSPSLRRFEFYGKLGGFVMLVQWIASRGQALARCGRAIAEGSTDQPVLNRPAFGSVQQQLRVG